MVNQIVKSRPFVAGRGRDFCRGCLGKELFSALNLGNLPLANELLQEPKTLIENFPLHLRVCGDCGLGQVEDVATPERIFRDYRYLSSMSSTFLQHAQDYVTERIHFDPFLSTDWVLEIASNDGYLLTNFLSHEIKVIGVEPAENVAKIARGKGIQTITEFFSKDLAQKILEEHGYPKLIIANNVMAHVPDLIDFVQGMFVLCGPETQISVENPSLANILDNLQFDTIYHEHYSYLSVTAVENICEMSGLKLFRVEQLSIHGGTNRYWISLSSAERQIDISVCQIKESERIKGLFDSQIWEHASAKVYGVLGEFGDWLCASREGNKRIFGYGAAAKASTILNLIPDQANYILGIADKSFEKQRRYMPPSGLKILSPEELFASAPTDIVIFPWNIKSEIASYLGQNLPPDVQLWCVVPKLQRVYPQ